MSYLYILATVFLAIAVGVMLGIAFFFVGIFIKKDWKDAATMAVWQPIPYMGYCADGPLSWWFYRKSIIGYDALFERNRLGLAWQKYWLNKAKVWSPVKLVKDGKEENR